MGKIVNSVFAAFFVALGIYMVFSMGAREPYVSIFLLAWIGCSYWFYKQETIKHIWKKSFILFAVESFLMPLAVFIFSVGTVVTETNGAAEEIGASIGGGIATGIAGFMGFFMGVVFLLIGLLAIKIPHDVRVVKGHKK